MNFRRYILAMVALALFTGFASAQVIVGTNTNTTQGPLTCVANVAVPPQLRSEGMTELIGDIVLTCTGGSPLAPGTTVPTANITVSLGTNVTSRLLGTGGSNPTNTSEALLLIDEPNTSGNPTQNGIGPTLGFTPCGNSAQGAGPGGCTQTVGTDGQSHTGTGAGANLFQGLVNANQVTFLGVPVNPPSTGGFARIYRITNVRANVSALGGGGLAGTTQLLASVSISGSQSLPVSNPVLVAGFIQAGLTTSLRNTANTGGGSNQGLNQCGGGGPSPNNILRYTENFGTAFKTRVAPGTNTTPGSGLSSTPTTTNCANNSSPCNEFTQAKPGTIYNSESGLITPVTGNAGLADYGTRLKAVFNNVPAGVRIFVSTANVINEFRPSIAQPPGDSTTPYAVLVLSETAPDANGFPPAATANSTVTFGSTTLNIWEVPIVNGTGTAVWEVTNVGSSSIDTLDFAVYQQFTANPGANSPPVGTATVNMSYAPTPPNAFSAAAGGAASSTLTIPRFADTSSATNIFNIRLCNTVLLFPFVTNQAGFDTGLAIANTTTDPFGTRNQNGSCNLNFYGASAPPVVNTGNIATGTVYTTLASTSAPGFQGYMIAVCQFQLAHGFAFVSDIGARNLAMGYLALVLPDGTDSRNNRTEALDN
jgi:hypothetical protein